MRNLATCELDKRRHLVVTRWILQLKTMARADFENNKGSDDDEKDHAD